MIRHSIITLVCLIYVILVPQNAVSDSVDDKQQKQKSEKQEQEQDKTEASSSNSSIWWIVGGAVLAPVAVTVAMYYIS